LDSTPERADLGEDAIRLTTSPRDPVSPFPFDDSILSAVRRTPDPHTQRSDDLP